MVYPVYSYRDNKVGFMPVQCDQNDATAIRGFAYAINGNSGVMNFSPKDFDLYKVGEFDTETGVFKSCVPVLIVSGESVIGVVNHE